MEKRKRQDGKRIEVRWTRSDSLEEEDQKTFQKVFSSICSIETALNLSEKMKERERVRK